MAHGSTPKLGGAPGALQVRADAWKNRPALECDGRSTTYQELFTNAALIAFRALSEGAGTEKRAGYLGRNSDTFFELLLGIGAAGGVMVPLGWRLTFPELLVLVDDAEMSLLFVEPEFANVATELRAARVNLHLVSVGGLAGEIATLDDWLGNEPAESSPPLPAIAPDAPFVQLYTSGTTGNPKGVVLSHGAVFALRTRAEAVYRPWDRWEQDDVVVVAMSVAHVAGTSYGLSALYNGAKALVMRDFDVKALLGHIDRKNATKIFLVPSAIAALLRHPAVRETDFSSLRFMNYGASPMPLPLLREAIEVMGCGFVQHYGMTETTGTIATLGPEDHDSQGNARMRSAGRAEPGVELRIVAPDLSERPSGEVGEVMIRTPNAFSGYWNRPEATAVTLIGGWIRTGDAGYIDEEGYLFIQDRLKDMIITGGENVYPAEVESVLHGFPNVADVAVIGVPDDRWGETVLAVVVASRGTSIDESDMLLWARQRLAGFKVPKRVVFANDLPRNASGKILRRQLRAPYWAGQERQIA